MPNDNAREPMVPHSRLQVPIMPLKYRSFRMDGKDYLMSLAPFTVSKKLFSLSFEEVSIYAHCTG